jgi:hypothetical protein
VGFDRIYPVYYEISFDPIKTHGERLGASLSKIGICVPRQSEEAKDFNVEERIKNY